MKTDLAILDTHATPTGTTTMTSPKETDKVKMIGDLIKQVGFPVVTAVFLMYFCLVTLKDNTAALTNLANQIALLAAKLH